MNWNDALLRVRALLFRARAEQELDEELNAHVELETLSRMRKGLSPEEARRSALVAFGGAERFAEECRDQRGTSLIEDFVRDVAYAVRQLRKSPGVYGLAAATLAIGIGATTAMFSTVYGVLLRPLPYAQPDRLVSVWCSEPSRGIPIMGCALPDLREIAKRNHSFDGFAGYYYRDFNLSDGTPERLPGQAVSTNLFALLGVSPSIGRTFSAEEESFGRHRVVVLSDSLWRRRFNARADVIGDSIRLNGEPHTIIGVMPAGFQFPDSAAELWTPLSFAPKDELATRNNHFISGIARLRNGTALEAARTEVRTIAKGLQKQFSSNVGVEADASDYMTSVVEDVRPTLRVLFGAVGILLIIACVNVANILLSQAAGRKRELSVRAALGASRGRLVRQLVSEGALLGIIGACAGIALSSWLIHLIRTFGPASIPRLRAIGIDASTLIFGAAVTLLSVLLFALAPALNLARASVSDALRQSGRSLTSGAGTNRSRYALVVVEITLSLVLVVGAGLLVRTLQRLSHVDPGLRAENVLTLSVTLPASRYPEQEPGKAARFFDDLTRNIARLPGAKAAGASTLMPIASWGMWGKYFTVDERPASRLADVPLIQYRQVTPDYLRALGISLREGRFFTEADAASQSLVAVINESARRRYFPNASPIGKRVFPAPPEATIRHLLPSPDFRIPRLTIIGVIGDVRQSGLMRPTEPELYVLHRQGVVPNNETPATKMFVFVRVDGDPLRFVAPVRAAVAALDPEQPVADVATMQSRLDAAVAPQRFQLFLFGVFAAVALALAAVGVYGVMSCSVRARLQEIGIRMALGASPSDVLRMMVRQGFALGAAGIALGGVLALVVTRLMSSLLFGVPPHDAPTFGGSSLLLAAVVFAASLAPSVRAARADPLAVLRAE